TALHPRSLHDALPISRGLNHQKVRSDRNEARLMGHSAGELGSVEAWSAKHVRINRRNIEKKWAKNRYVSKGFWSKSSKCCSKMRSEEHTSELQSRFDL